MVTRSVWFAVFVAAGLGAGTAPPRPPVVVVRTATVVQLGRSATLTVRGVDHWDGLEVRLVGSTTAAGLVQPWFTLGRQHGLWSGVIPPLETRGVYPIQLRRRPGAGILRSRQWLFRVLAADTLTRPSFATPEQAAAAWVRKLGTVRAMRRWRLPDFDHRLPALHQLLAVSYSPRGRSSPNDRLGLFVTAVQTSFGGGWRFLEAKVAP